MTGASANRRRPVILVTGAQGQVGWELQRTLAPLGRIVAVDVPDIELSDRASIARVVRSVRPSIIVNPAAYTAVDRAEREEDLATRVNAEAPGLLAEEARRLDVPLVHFSTDYVFDGRCAIPYREDDPPNPQSVYGRTKRAGEQAVAAVGARSTILRLSWVYGARGSNFLRTMLRLAAERDRLRVVDDQRGAPTWCRAVAEATVYVVREHLAGGDRANGLFHLPAAGETTWFGFASAIFRGVDPRLVPRAPALEPISTSETPTAAPRPAYSVLDGSKLETALGVHLPDWEAQLRWVLDDLKEQVG